MKKRVLICMLTVMMIGLYLPAFVFAEAAAAASEKTEVTEDITAEPSTASEEQSEEDNKVASTSVDDEEESLDEADDQLVAEEESLDEENQQADEEEDLDEADDQQADNEEQGEPDDEDESDDEDGDDADDADDEDDDWDVDKWWEYVEWSKDEDGNEYYVYDTFDETYTIMKDANGDIYFIKDGNRYDLNKGTGLFEYTDEEGNLIEIYLNIGRSPWGVASIDDQPTPLSASLPESERSASKAKTAATADQEETPDTGDATPLVAYVMIFAAASALLAGILIKRYREN